MKFNDYFLVRAIRFTSKHWLKNPRYMIAYGLAYFQPQFSFKVAFYSGEELLKLIQEGKSIVRYGDGEVALMNFRSLAFQKFDERIRQGMFKGILNYRKDSPYIIGINERAILRTNEEQRKEQTLQLLLPQKVYFWLFFPKKLKYIDASFFYYNENVDTYLAPALKNREIIFVTRKATLDSIKNNERYPYAAYSHFIETKESNAFDEYDEVCKKVRDLISELKAQGNTRKPLIVAAFGAGTKVFAYEMAMQGVQVLDIGTGIEILYQDKRIDDILKPKKSV